MITEAFTCTGAYAVLIMLGIKRVENRNVMPPAGRGRCAISCSKSFCREEFGNFIQWAANNLSEEDFERLPAWVDVKDWPGKIIGTCDYTARRRNDLQLSADGGGRGKKGAALSWDEGYAYWWDLSEVYSLDFPIPCRGNVGMWQLPLGLDEVVTTADTLARSVGTKISLPDDARRIFNAALPLAGESEGFFVLPLDDQNCTLSEPALISLGTSSVTTTVRPMDVFAPALREGAASIIVAHNHPSGDPTPSIQDRRLTEELTRLGDTLGIRVVDHLILTDSCERV